MKSTIREKCKPSYYLSADFIFILGAASTIFSTPQQHLRNLGGSSNSNSSFSNSLSATGIRVRVQKPSMKDLHDLTFNIMAAVDDLLVRKHLKNFFNIYFSITFISQIEIRLFSCCKRSSTYFMVTFLKLFWDQF